MKLNKTSNRKGAILCTGASLLAKAFASSAIAQEANTQKNSETVVVTGFKSSVRSAIAAKKLENDIVDTIKAEDIGKFPDNNLAESCLLYTSRCV